PQGDRDGRPRLGVDGIRLGRGAALQLRRRRAEHVPDLERDAAGRARRLRARLLPRLPDRPRVVHRSVLRQPRLVDDQRLGVEVPDSEVTVDIRLRPLREDEFAQFLAAQRCEYVRSLVEEAGMTPAEAEDKATADHASLFPDGAAKPEHRIAPPQNGARPLTLPLPPSPQPPHPATP